MCTQLGSASVLDKDDVIYAQYRETGVLLYRGYTLQNAMDQCFSNVDDLGHGKQVCEIILPFVFLFQIYFYHVVQKDVQLAFTKSCLSWCMGCVHTFVEGLPTNKRHLPTDCFNDYGL